MGYTTLVFVYNTDANPMSLLAEFMREQLDGTFECSLCHLTYGKFMKRREWREFIDELPIDVRFHLRSRFKRRHPDLANRTFPAVLIEDDAHRHHDFMDAGELADCETIDDLMTSVRSRLERLLSPHSTES